jgi:hypothetical protein
MLKGRGPQEVLPGVVTDETEDVRVTADQYPTILEHSELTGCQPDAAGLIS